jgi:hypothetical protein
MHAHQKCNGDAFVVFYTITSKYIWSVLIAILIAITENWHRCADGIFILYSWIQNKAKLKYQINICNNSSMHTIQIIMRTVHFKMYTIE